MGRKLTLDKILDKFRNIHLDKYDYSKFDYINMKTNSVIICKEHGEFLQSAFSHLHNCGCPKCSHMFTDSEKFINRVQKIHKNYYDYSKFIYINLYTKSCVICPEHGKFFTSPTNHLHNKSRCPSCYGKNPLTTDEFITRSRDIHKHKYDYSNSEYKNSKTKIIITCHEHGDFLQYPSHHLYNKAGCPICKSSKGELQIRNFLEENNINFVQQKKFDSCKNIRNLPFDFYIQITNTCIEYDGIQHFQPVDIFGGEKAYKKIVKSDSIKTKFCNDNNIKLIRISYKDDIDEKMKELYE